MTMVTATWPRRTVPPLLKPTPLIPCFSSQWLTMSKMPTTGTSSSFAMSIASATWSAWPWVSRRWVAPAIASPRRAGSKSGLPSQGSRSSTWSSISMRKPLWPSQLSLMVGSSPTSYGSPGRDVIGLVRRGQQLLRADGRELLVRAAERGFERGLPGGGVARLADGGAGRGPGGAGARAHPRRDRGGVVALPHPCPGLGDAGRRGADPGLHPGLPGACHRAVLRRALVGRGGGRGGLRAGERAGGARGSRRWRGR